MTIDELVALREAWEKQRTEGQKGEIEELRLKIARLEGIIEGMKTPRPSGYWYGSPYTYTPLTVTTAEVILTNLEKSE